MLTSILTYNLPALTVVLLLLAAPAVALMPSRHRPWAWLLTSATCALVFAAAAVLFARSLGAPPMSYAMGGWAPPYGIEIRVDTANALVLLLTTFMALAAILFGYRPNQDEVAQRQHGLFYSAFLLCLLGLCGMALTGDLFNLFVFIEIASLGTYALIAAGRDRRALTSSFQYLIMGTIGATFYLIGVGLLYSLTGTLNMADMHDRLLDLEAHRTIVTALCFIVIGLALKVAVFPLHLWLPGAYTNAPTMVTLFLAATATKVSLYALTRILFAVFGIDNAFSLAPLGELLMVLSLLAIFSGSIAAIWQGNLKRLLAYSSVAQVGYMTLGLSLATGAGLTAAFLHIVNHGLMKAALFMAVGCMVYAAGSARLEALRGLGKDKPWLLLAFALAGLSLIGVPTTAGFISKWYLILALLESDLWWVAALVVVSSLLAVIYIWRVVEALFFQERPSDAPPLRAIPLSMSVLLWLLVAANFYFGLETSLTIGGVEEAVMDLIPGGAQ
jgi:multicomponent Na+:H+ antiporter subunit D